MYSKLILTTLLSLALAAPQHPPAAQYPAGVNPQDCPNFPICDNARLHNPHQASHWGAPPAPAWPAAHAWQQAPSSQQWGAPAAPAWNDAPTWNAAPAWHGAPSGPAAAGGDKYPAGISPHSCPNYPFCDVNAGHHGAPVAAPPLPGWSERLYPAGVSAHECPNFPYCH